MLRLVPQREPRWIDLPDFGVRIKLRPLTTAVLTAARAECTKRMAAMQKEVEDQQRAGFDPDPVGPGWGNPNWRLGMMQQMLTETLIRYAAQEWEGVTDEAGAPLPINAASAQAFAEHDKAAEAFLTAALAPVDAVAAEGNGSAPSSPGAGELGANTAPDAATADAPPVPLN